MNYSSVALACISLALSSLPQADAFTLAPRPRAFAMPTTSSRMTSASTPPSRTAMRMSSASKESDPPVEYDYIIVGLGYAGAILTARMAERNPDKKILAIEYGGPIQAITGGASAEDISMDMTASAFQNEGSKSPDGKYDPKSPLCMADVPGNYNNVAFRPLTDGYHLEEFPACFQGTGLGGNGAYNGALYQEPAHWWWNDEIHNDIFVTDEMKKEGKFNTVDVLQPYFDKVHTELKDAIKSKPSSDGEHYNHGLYDLVKPYLEKANFTEAPLDTPQLEVAGDRFYTVPTVNTKEGVRTGASAWLEKFMDETGEVKKEFPNLEVKTYTEVLRVQLNPDNSVKGVDICENVHGAKRGGMKTHNELKSSVFVKKGGKVILGCGALPSNRILYQSGVGPEEIREIVTPGRKETFRVNNEAIGTTINEHVTTSLGFKFTGEDKEQPHTVHFDPADYNGNSKWLADYATNRSGPYTQYGPVVASHFRADLSRLEPLQEKNLTTGLDDGKVTTELFYNPFGAGPYPPESNRALNPYNGPGTFTVYVMLLRPEMRGLFRLKDDERSTAEYVTCYMNDIQKEGETIPNKEQREKLGLEDYRDLAKKDIATMTASVHEVLEITKNAPDIKINLGPGDKQSDHLFVEKNLAIADLDPSNITDVRKYCTFYDGASIVNGEYLAMTHMEENHYHSTTPLARNLDVFGKDLGDRKDTYGVDPDTCEVKGAKGLCVVDAGIFPKVVYCHPIGSVMAVAEWAADRICPEKE